MNQGRTSEHRFGGRLRASAREWVRIRLQALAGVPDLERRLDEAEGSLGLLASSHHETRFLTFRPDLDGVAERVDRLEQQAADIAAYTDNVLGFARNLETAIGETGSHLDRLLRLASLRTFGDWIALADVPPSLVVTVVLPTHNRADRLRRAIQSVLDQTYERWELIVVDDASTDETSAVLDKVDDERVRVLRTEKFRVGAVRNVGVESAVGDVIIYLDDDNMLHPMWLKSIVWAFTQRPDVDVLYGARVVDDERRLFDADAAGGMPWIQFDPYDRARLEQGNYVDVGVIAHRRGLSGATFDESLPVMADWDLFLRLTADRPPLELPAIAMAYTTDAGDRLSASAVNEAAHQMILDRLAAPTPSNSPSEIETPKG